MNDATQLLSALFATLDDGEYIELRCKRQSTQQEFFQSVGELVTAVSAVPAGTEVFFGIATRDGNGGRKGNLIRIPGVWADLDAKPGLHAPADRLNAAPLEPSAIVNSGKGLHCYWFFDEPLLAMSSIVTVENINKGIAKVLDGDSVHDAGRVLRLPDTYNYKYRGPLPVQLMRLEPDLRYSVKQLESAFPLTQKPKGVVSMVPALPSTTPVTTTPTVAASTATLPCRMRMSQGVQEGHRNSACHQLAIDLKQEGIAQSEAQRILIDWNTRNIPPMDIAEVTATVASVYNGDYIGLGCDKRPMSGCCEDTCPVKKATSARNLPEAASGIETVPVLSVWSWSALLKRPVTPVEFVVDGLIPRRGVTLITGEGGIGKSITGMDLAYSVGSGSRFLHKFECVQGPVLYVDLENEEASITRRVQKITAGRLECGDTEDEIPVYVVKKGDLAEARLSIDDQRGKAALCNSIERYRPSLLIIDPLVAVHSKDENSNVEMRQVITTLQEIAHRHDLGIVVVHHPRKRGTINDGGQMIRGASDLRNAVDSHLFLRKVSGEQVLVEHDKSRHAPPVAKFTFSIVDNAEGTATLIRYSGASTESLEKTASARECIVGALREAGELRRCQLVDRVVVEGISKSTAERVLRDLMDEGIMIQPEERGPYRLSEGCPEQIT